MRKIVAPFLIVAFMLGGGYWYYTAFAGCDVPMTYRIGDIDERFDTSEDEARTAISTAESLWEDSTGRNLFTYDTDGEIVINFVYDERQERANEEEELREVLEQKEGMSDSLKAQYENLVSEYQVLKETYQTALSQYEARLVSYNDEVAEWNDRGGAPKDVYTRLNETQDSLSKEERRLSGYVVELNTLARNINNLGNRGNSIISDYNSLVNEYNDEFSEGQEFTQGDYKAEVINIYEYGTPEELSLVLAHEFGHALGVDHVEGKESIMYHFMEDQTLEMGLTAQDLVAFESLCGTPDSLSESLLLLIENLKRLIARS
jgi:hypothetical protein